jgi:hypothetical protein
MRKCAARPGNIAETRYVSIRKSYANEGFAFIWRGKAQGGGSGWVILALVLCNNGRAI